MDDDKRSTAIFVAVLAFLALVAATVIALQLISAGKAHLFRRFTRVAARLLPRDLEVRLEPFFIRRLYAANQRFLGGAMLGSNQRPLPREGESARSPRSTVVRKGP
jgi:hypothetical protein